LQDLRALRLDGESIAVMGLVAIHELPAKLVSG